MKKELLSSHTVNCQDRAEPLLLIYKDGEIDVRCPMYKRKEKHCLLSFDKRDCHYKMED